MEDTVRLDRKSFEALAAQSRVSILKSLSKRRKTLSELAKELGLPPSTMKEHLDVLASAGLVIQQDEGRKWKYYELTRKGKGIVAPRELKVLIMLGISLLLVLGSGWNFLGAYAPAGMEAGAAVPGGGAAPALGEESYVPIAQDEEAYGQAGGAEAQAEQGQAPVAMEGDSSGENEKSVGGEGDGEAHPAENAESAWGGGAEAQFPYVEAALFGASAALLLASAAYFWKGMRHRGKI